ncbi:hypothetical protein Tco_0927197 [Tanacetum coccineum]
MVPFLRHDSGSQDPIRDDIPKEDMLPVIREEIILTVPSHQFRAYRPLQFRNDDIPFSKVNLRVIQPVTFDECIAERSEDFYTQLLDHVNTGRDRDLILENCCSERCHLIGNDSRHKRTHIDRMGEAALGAEDDRHVTQKMRTHVLEARAQIDTVEDTGSSLEDLEGLCNLATGTVPKHRFHENANPLTFQGNEELQEEVERLQILCQKANQETLNINYRILGSRETMFATALYTQRFQELALMCTKFLADETAKIDKYIGGLPDSIHGNVMSARPKTLDDAIELANYLMDQKLRTYAERQNDNKRKADDSSRNNQQPYKKQNVTRAYTAGPSEKKVYTGDLPLCTKCNYHHTGQCAPKCGKCKRYGHTTTDCRVNTNNNNNNKNNNKNQKT